MQPAAFVYILASQRNGTLYTGSTTDLARRVWEHRIGAVPGFTRDHGVTLLVWYDGCPDVVQARQREHALKRWRRAWKLALIEAMNPAWRDLALDLNA
ncbi:MAG: GIY-YIG nuclease family protein [Methylobacterium sp.]|uniref:GIY-YIG nuclease family protein n=1 Tax=Methylobacterium sp. TaxID=409 RepID=UPI002719144F|nr:GIY-YIG nuclease family protein [Methylobacterium sp.]MDO9425820.1 GIY-YIG nuclease family protein [Methylobacterium sp.]